MKAVRFARAVLQFDREAFLEQTDADRTLTEQTERRFTACTISFRATAWSIFMAASQYDFWYARIAINSNNAS